MKSFFKTLFDIVCVLLLVVLIAGGIHYIANINSSDDFLVNSVNGIVSLASDTVSDKILNGGSNNSSTGENGSGNSGTGSSDSGNTFFDESSKTKLSAPVLQASDFQVQHWEDEPDTYSCLLFWNQIPHADYYKLEVYHEEDDDWSLYYYCTGTTFYGGFTTSEINRSFRVIASSYNYELYSDSEPSNVILISLALFDETSEGGTSSGGTTEGGTTEGGTTSGGTTEGGTTSGGTTEGGTTSGGTTEGGTTSGGTTEGGTTSGGTTEGGSSSSSDVEYYIRGYSYDGKICVLDFGDNHSTYYPQGDFLFYDCTDGKVVQSGKSSSYFVPESDVSHIYKILLSYVYLEDGTKIYVLDYTWSDPINVILPEKLETPVLQITNVHPDINGHYTFDLVWTEYLYTVVYYLEYFDEFTNVWRVFYRGQDNFVVSLDLYNTSFRVYAETSYIDCDSDYSNVVVYQKN